MKTALLILALATSLCCAAEIPDTFGGMRFRVINGKVYDFGKVIVWANQYVILKPTHTGGGHGGYGEVYEPRKKTRAEEDNDQAYQYVQSFAPKYGKMLISGTVRELTDDGIILMSNGRKILLKNHPNQKTLVDGDAVRVLAMESGIFKKDFDTMKAYDHGTAAPGKNQQTPTDILLE